MYEKKYRNTKFTFNAENHTYTTRVINVTFKFSLKNYNKIKKNVYVKYGHKISDLNFTDSVCIINGELVGIEVGKEVNHPINSAILGKHFYFDNDCYHIKNNLETIMSTSQLREHLYKNGFMCDSVNYVRFKRSSGSARVGKCLFIDKKLSTMMKKWSHCGLKIKDGQKIDLAALEAYISLTTSSIIDTLEISPNNILVIDDYDSIFKDKVVETTIGNDGWLETREINATIKNSIWDGQSLIDKSLMGKYSDKGMILLRARFFKSCCFNTNIQDFFANHEITEVSQLNGFTLAKNIEDVKLITTPSSIKYLKFGKLNDWLSNIDGIFGVVKYEKPTHFFDGGMVQLHYQLLNSLQLTRQEVDKLLKPSLELLTMIKNDPDILRFYIKYSDSDDFDMNPAISKNDVIYKLLGLNRQFAKTKLYDDFKKDLVKAYIKTLRMGKILSKGTYATMCGNPIEMLKHSIGLFNGESDLGVGNISCSNFEYNKVLLGSRSPHISVGNVLLTNNVKNENIERYLNSTNNIVYVNSIEENLLQRLSGADFDSDTILLTSNNILIENAQKNYSKFKVAVCNVDSKIVDRHYTASDKCDLDIKSSKNLIGELVNLSQELNTIMFDALNGGAEYNEIKDIYSDVCQLNVLASIEIDKAKKEFTINSHKELNKIREKYLKRDTDNRVIKPYFFSFIAKQKGFYDSKKNYYKKHKTTMDFIEQAIDKYQRSRNRQCEKEDFIKFYKILDDSKYDPPSVSQTQVNRIINIIKEFNNQSSYLFSNTDIDAVTKHKMYQELRQNCIEYIGNIKFNRSTMIYMLRVLDTEMYKNIYKKVFSILFGHPNSSFYNIIKESKSNISKVEKCDAGDIVIFGEKFVKK